MLTVRRRVLSFPGALAPGFDPTHVAGPNPLFSGISIGGGFISLLSGAVGTLSGSGYTSAIDGMVGPVSQFNGTTNVITFPFSSATLTSVTLAAIFRTNTLPATTGQICGDSNATTGYAIGFNAATNFQFFSAANNATAIAGKAVAGVPYFYAVSATGTGGSTTTAVLKRLDNGEVFSNSGFVGQGSLAGNTSFVVGNSLLGTRPAPAGIAAVMMSSAFMSIAQLLQWANDPWSFWYPSRALDLIVGPAAAVIASRRNQMLPLLGVGG